VDDAEIYAFLAELFRDLFDRDDIVLRPELTAGDVDGWDSFKQVEILVATEAQFGVKFRTREIDGLHSLGDLVALVRQKTA
jgi:acyl carrier protein